MLSRTRREDDCGRSSDRGLVSGASDDDPSGIATYSQAGAQFGFGLMLIICIPELSLYLPRKAGLLRG